VIKLLFFLIFVNSKKFQFLSDQNFWIYDDHHHQQSNSVAILYLHVSKLSFNIYIKKKEKPLYLLIIIVSKLNLLIITFVIFLFCTHYLSLNTYNFIRLILSLVFQILKQLVNEYKKFTISIFTLSFMWFQEYIWY